MSYDFDMIPTDCDHRIVRERYGIDSEDLRTLYYLIDPTRRMRARVNGLNRVTMTINGVPVPKDHPRFGYQVLLDEYSSEPDQRSKIVFDNPIRDTNILIEIGYYTNRAGCSKCAGSNIVSDYKMDDYRTFERVENADKLLQKAMKYILTSRHKVYPSLTSPVRNYVGGKFGSTLTTDRVTQDIINSLDAMKKVQAIQSKVQYCSAKELLKDILNVTANTSESDPSILVVKIELSSFTNEVVTSEFGLNVR